ncbi:MAG: chromate transporter [Eubacteriales bacterium]|nr:chromate transporter [Eubacteriales bacterium]
MNYLQLFLAFLQIGAFSFGGGYAAMPLIQAQVIDKYHWLTIQDFTNLITIAEMTPGPIAVNSATFVGSQVAGVPGALCATIGCILPSCIFVTILARLYARYRNLRLMKGILLCLRPAVVSMILTAGITILTPAFFRDGAVHFAAGSLQLRYLIYFAAALFCLRKVKLDPIRVMVSCGLAEVLYQWLLRFLA